MDFGSVNWLAVVVCVVLAMISGLVWYHPKLFFPAWWEGIGKLLKRVITSLTFCYLERSSLSGVSHKQILNVV